MTRLLRDRGGSATILFFGLFFAIVLFTFVVLEMGGAMERYDQARTVLQRSVNSAVEANMDEAYRADRILRLNVDAARASFISFANEDMPKGFRLTVKSVTGTAQPPSLTATGTVTFPALFSPFGDREVTVGFTVKARNFAVDGR